MPEWANYRAHLELKRLDDEFNEAEPLFDLIGWPSWVSRSIGWFDAGSVIGHSLARVNGGDSTPFSRKCHLTHAPGSSFKHGWV
jgi:hypothetical protein